MENESKNPDLALCPGHIFPADTKRVAINVEWFNESVKKMLEIIGDGSTAADGSLSNNPKCDQLIALLEEINQKHQLLAEHYNHFVDNLQCNLSSKSQGGNSVSKVCEATQDSSLLTPDQKSVLQKAFDFPPSSGGSSFANSGKEGSESSPLLPSDSDSESYNSSPNKWFTPGGELANGSLNVRVTETYDIMLFRITKCEEELRASNEQLLLLEQENTRLKSELKNAFEAMNDSRAKVEKAQNEVTIRENDVHLEKGKVSELQMHAAALETEVSDARNKIWELNAALQDALRDSEVQKTMFETQYSSLSKDWALDRTRLAEKEKQMRLLKDEVKKHETSAIEMKSSYEALEIRWKSEIQGLKAQLNDKIELVESCNKAQDALKLKFHLLMAERDGLNAKAQSLGAELCSAEYNIQQMEARHNQLQMQNLELIEGSETERKLKEELGIKVEKLEEEVERQAAMIKDRAEEKREAIRQLCISLEHYRNGYNELRQAYIWQTRHAVIAS